MLNRVIAEEFGCHYHPGHVRKLLHEIGFSVQRPKRMLARANPAEQDKWHRYTYPNLRNAREGAALIFEDEAGFRQDSTLYQTWASIGSQLQIPVTGQRKSVKFFGAVEVYAAQFTCHQANVFNAVTYLAFLEQLARRYCPKRTHLIQDNACCHKDATGWDWFKDNWRWLEVYQLPA
jgi:hypothetical protein